MCSDPECTQWGYKTRGQIHARARHSKSAAKSKVKGGAKKAQSATEYQHCTLFINENFKVLWTDGERLVFFWRISRKPYIFYRNFMFRDCWSRAQESVVPILSDIVILSKTLYDHDNFQWGNHVWITIRSAHIKHCYIDFSAWVRLHMFEYIPATECITFIF